MPLPLRTLAPLALVAALVLPATAARAGTFCVGAPAGCHGTASATLQDALDAAAVAPGADRVALDAGLTVYGFTIVAGNAVDLVGVNGVPTIVADSADPVTIDEPQATVRSMSFEAGGSGTPAPIQLRRGAIAGSRIVNATTGTAVRVVDGSLQSTRMTSNIAVDAVGVLADGGTATLQDTSIEDTTGIVADGATLTLNRVRVTAGAISGPASSGGSAMRVTGGTVTADDSAFALAGAGGDAAIDVHSPTGATAVTLRSVTVHPRIEDGRPASTQGVRAACSGGTANVELLDTVVTAYSPDIVSAGTGCVVDRQHIAYMTAEASGGAMIDAGSFLFDTPVPGRTWVELTPTFGSILIDHGGGRPAAAGETDLNGLPRVVDGRRDIGAYEYQHRAPQITLLGEAPARVDALQDFAVRGEDPDRDPVTVTWTVDDMPVVADDPNLPGLLRVRFRSAGRHFVGVRVTDASGLASQLEQTVKVVSGDQGDGPVKLPPPVVTPRVVTPPFGPPIAAGLLSRRIGSGSLRVQVACRRVVVCAGMVRLTAKVGGRTLRLGHAVRFRVDAGRTAVVGVPLTTAARRSLRRHRGLTVRVTVLRTSGWPWMAGTGARVRL